MFPGEKNINSQKDRKLKTKINISKLKVPTVLLTDATAEKTESCVVGSENDTQDLVFAENDRASDQGLLRSRASANRQENRTYYVSPPFRLACSQRGHLASVGQSVVAAHAEKDDLSFSPQDGRRA